MASQAMEDYLLAIYRLEDLGRRPGTGEVAQELGVSAASTTAMFKRLAQEGLVSYREYGGVSLSERGRALALGLIRRHRLAERFLTDLLDLPWEGVHEIADRLEHALPPEVIERFAGLLGEPRTCPHGHPIPTRDGRLPYIEVRPLGSVEVGETAVVALVEERDAALLRHLGELGLKPGARVRVVEREPFDGSMRLECDGREILVSGRVAGAVAVHA